MRRTLAPSPRPEDAPARAMRGERGSQPLVVASFGSSRMRGRGCWLSTRLLHTAKKVSTHKGLVLYEYIYLFAISLGAGFGGFKLFVVRVG